VRQEFAGRVVITWPAAGPGQTYLSAPGVTVHDAETGTLIPCTRLLINRIEPTSGPITADVWVNGERVPYLVAEMRTADGFDPSKSINEQRVARGLPPLEMPEAARPLWRTESGVTFEPPK